MSAGTAVAAPGVDSQETAMKQQPRDPDTGLNDERQPTPVTPEVKERMRKEQEAVTGRPGGQPTERPEDRPPDAAGHGGSAKRKPG